MKTLLLSFLMTAVNNTINQKDLMFSPTPFDGRNVKGKILATFIQGNASHVDPILKQRLLNEF